MPYALFTLQFKFGGKTKQEYSRPTEKRNSLLSGIWNNRVLTVLGNKNAKGRNNRHFLIGKGVCLQIFRVQRWWITVLFLKSKNLLLRFIYPQKITFISNAFAFESFLRNVVHRSMNSLSDEQLSIHRDSYRYCEHVLENTPCV